MNASEPQRFTAEEVLGGAHPATTKRAVLKAMVRNARSHQELLMLVLAYGGERWTHNRAWADALGHIARRRAVDLGWDVTRWDGLVEKSSKVDPYFWRAARRGDFTGFPGRVGEWLATPPPPEEAMVPASYCIREASAPLPGGPPVPVRPVLRLLQGGRATG
ncbi:MAG: hypothetical protein EPO40_17705 [Myxococcaceae bacterium]|nr:MAG: hypothetical protein EPO40_17705 [Myxococcaceae bacterium]